jgi:hypothetical protein
VCQSGACACVVNADCDGGSPGTCSGGLCVCGDATVCTVGQRCLAGGVCG